MSTHTALTIVDDEAAARALGEALEQLTPAPSGIGVTRIEDGSGRWEVGGYFTAPPDEVALAVLAAAFGARDFAVSRLPDTDWVAHVRRELTPVEAGRFFLYGAHDADKVPVDGRRIALCIEATMAFGTGHHGTTRGCLLALDRLAADGWRSRAVADIGTGTAVLAMAAARLFPRARVIAADIDPVATDVARANIAVNALAGRVACVTAPGLAHPVLQEGAPFDLVLANILKKPLITLAPDIAARTAPDGRVILAGLLADQAEDVAAAYHALGFRLERRDDDDGWATLVMGRAPIR